MLSQAATATNEKNSLTEHSKVTGRNFQHISASGDGQSLLISECSPDGNKKCLMYEYDLVGQKINYLPASISREATGEYDGSNIIVSQYDAHTKSTRIKILEKANGSIAEIATISGIASAPKRIAAASLVYWKGETSAQNITKYDVWELNTKSAREHLFAGRHQFFSYSSINVLDQSKVLVSAEGPAAFAQDIAKYWAKYNRSAIYVTSRGEPDLPKPVYINATGANVPVMAGADNLFFSGEDNGMFVFEYSGSKEIARFRKPTSFGAILQSTYANSSAKLYFIYQFLNSGERGNYGIVQLDTRTSQWTTLNISAPLMPQ